MSHGRLRTWSSSAALDVLIGSLLLAAIDVALVLGRGLREFLTSAEVAAYAVTALTTACK